MSHVFKHLLLCFSAIWMSSLVKCLFKLFIPLFKIEFCVVYCCFVGALYICWVQMYIQMKILCILQIYIKYMYNIFYNFIYIMYIINNYVKYRDCIQLYKRNIQTQIYRNRYNLFPLQFLFYPLNEIFRWTKILNFNEVQSIRLLLYSSSFLLLFKKCCLP